MPSWIRITRFVWGCLAIAALAGCAARHDAGTPVGVKAAEAMALEGSWVGQVWEMPVHYVQGVRTITLQIARDGSWTAAAGGTQCASGTASFHGGLVVLGGTRVGQDYCVPYSLSTNDGRMRAVFETSFKGRPASAMIGFDRPPAAAQTTAR